MVGVAARAGRRLSRTYVQADASSENSSLTPIWRAPAVGTDVRQRVFDITMATKAEALEALRCGCGSLGGRHLTSRFSSFVLKTCSHQEWWFDGLTWLNRPATRQGARRFDARQANGRLSGVRSYIIQYRGRNTSASRRLTIGQHGRY
jgi:hypothetical protein